jgi:feruloyl-CoA synthase
MLAACSPMLQDAIIAGDNREFVGMLAWLNVSACQALIGDRTSNAPRDLCRHPTVRGHLVRTIARWNSEQSGSSMRISRLLVLAEPPSIDANEITDKGYVNQRLALERRWPDVERLFASVPDDEVIVT